MPAIKVNTELGTLQITCLYTCGKFHYLRLETSHSVEFRGRLVQFAIELDVETKKAINHESVLIGVGPKCSKYLPEVIELLEGPAAYALEQHGEKFFQEVKKYASWEEIERTREQIKRLQNERIAAEQELEKLEADFANKWT